MSGVQTTTRTTVRTLSVATATALALLVMACGSSAATSGAQTPSATRPSDCGAAGKVYAQKILVSHEDERFTWITLFIVCKPDGGLAIVDSDGHDYQDLNDFRANNELLGADDEMTLPRNFPSLDRSGNLDLMTVSGHTSTSWPWWPAGGAVLVLLVSGSGFLWLRARRRSARAAACDADLEEPSP